MHAYALRSCLGTHTYLHVVTIPQTRATTKFRAATCVIQSETPVKHSWNTTAEHMQELVPSAPWGPPVGPPHSKVPGPCNPITGAMQLLWPLSVSL